MQLNLWVVKDELEVLVKECSISSDRDLQLFKYPIIYQPGAEFDEDALYVVDVRNPKAVGPYPLFENIANRPYSVICVGDIPRPLKDDPLCDGIGCYQSSDVATLCNLLQKMFCKYNEWTEQLDKAVEQGRTLADVVARSMGIVRNDLWIYDSTNTLIAHKVFDNIRLSCEQVNEVREHGLLPGKWLVNQTALPSLLGVGLCKGTLVAHEANCVLGTVEVGDAYSVTVMVESNFREVSERDALVLATFVPYVAKCFYNVASLGRVERTLLAAQIFKRMLDGQAIDLIGLRNRLQTLSWSPADRYVCACFGYHDRLEVQDGFSVRPFFSLQEQLLAEFELQSFSYKDDFVAVVNLTAMGVGVLDLIKRLERFARLGKLVIGVSNPMNDITQLQGMYKQSLAALGIGQRDEDGPFVTFFGEHLVDYMAECVTSDMQPHHLVPQGVFDLIEYDKEHQSELYETLRAYVRSNCKPTATCKELFIQRNSLAYRLGKIQKLTGFDFDDPDMCLILLMSCKVIDIWGA